MIGLQALCNHRVDCHISSTFRALAGSLLFALLFHQQWWQGALYGLAIVATATVAAYASLGGLGRYLIDGIKVRQFHIALVGALMVTALALILDAALAKRYFDAETAGLFAKAATIARTAVFLPVPIATALFPKVSSAGELSPESWGLLGRALAFAGLLIGAAVAVCVAFPVLPWTILYGAWPPEAATSAAALTRAGLDSVRVLGSYARV